MKTVIEMAREVKATAYTNRHYPDRTTYTFGPEQLERFAELVRADEREHIAAWMIQRGYSTGHGDTTKDLLDELDWQVVQNWTSAMKTGVETEREACAKVCEELDIEGWMDAGWDMGTIDCAAAIRARGQA